MYCVKCGVELEKGRESCPLCGTKVLYEEEGGVRATTVSILRSE